MNFDTTGRELLRALRAERSQVALSRRLGFSTNVVYTWEAGRRSAPFSALWQVAARVGIGLDEVLARFLTVVPESVSVETIETDAGCAAFLRELRGEQPLLALSEATGFSRHALSRWLSGRAEPTLGQALAVLEAATHRGLDFVACFVDPAALASTSEPWRVLTVRRTITFDHPWSPAVLRALELTDYRALPEHVTGWIAARLGVPVEEEVRCLDALGDAGLIRREGGHFVGLAVTVDTRPGPELARRAVKRHWAQLGVAHLSAGSPGLYSYNVFGVSRADLARIEALHAAYFNDLRAIVAGSEPVECVAVVNLQVFELRSG
jgi:transcriptional regulator with XRE-family HTH domain